MKRITYWPQLVLGITFNVGVLISFAAVTSTVNLSIIFLYFAGIFWTLGYDTIYAHQDKEDDFFIGIKSSALALGANTKPWLFLFYLTALSFLGASAHEVGLSWPFWAAFLFGAVHFGWQLKRLDINHPASCLSKFKSNRDFGLIIFLGIVASRAL